MFDLIAIIPPRGSRYACNVLCLVLMENRTFLDIPMCEVSPKHNARGCVLGSLTLILVELF